MSILETVDKVRKTEEEADRLLEEARQAERAAVAEALARRRDLLEEARLEADEAIARMRLDIEGEKERKRREVESATETRKKGLRLRAGRNADEATRRALKLFLSSVRRGEE